MSYLDNKKFAQKKDLKLVKILAEQKANLTGVNQAVVKRLHGVYGEYYETISKNEAEKTGEHVLHNFRPLPAQSVLPGNKLGKSKTADYAGKPAGD